MKMYLLVIVSGLNNINLQKYYNITLNENKHYSIDSFSRLFLTSY